ncbi:MAG TPA: hypothetical protein VID25_03940 [Candidatus Limnocylindrales bacterium]
MIRRRWPLILLGASVASLLGCGVGGAPTNGVVEAVNLSRASASFHWQSPGLLGMPLFGATGTEPIGPCGSYVRSFGAGDQAITIGSATTSRSFILQAPAEGPQAELIIVITADGGITSVDRDHVPPSPFCP